MNHKLCKIFAEVIWWAIGIILLVALIFLVFAMETPAHAQTAPKPPDFVSRSLDKVVISRGGQRLTAPAPSGAGTRYITVTPRSYQATPKTPRKASAPLRMSPKLKSFGRRF